MQILVMMFIYMLLHVVAEIFGSPNRQKAYIDIKVINPFAKSDENEPMTQCCQCIEQDKKHSYEARVHAVEFGLFTPHCFLFK